MRVGVGGGRDGASKEEGEGGSTFVEGGRRDSAKSTMSRGEGNTTAAREEKGREGVAGVERTQQEIESSRVASRVEVLGAVARGGA